MFELDEQTRSALFAAAVLTLDETGNDVFTGLTSDETQFVYARQTSRTNTAEEIRFRQLVERFTVARGLAMQHAEAEAKKHLDLIRSGQTPIQRDPGPAITLHPRMSAKPIWRRW